MSHSSHYPYLRTTFVLISALLVMIFSNFLTLAPAQVQLGLLAAVATIGLSHGSLDWVLARHWGLWHNAKQGGLFILGYSAIVLISLAAWQLAPSLCLLVFLFMSLSHFANDWQAELSWSSRHMLGLTVIALPSLNYQTQVQQVFALLTNPTTAAVIAQGLQQLSYLSLVLTALLALQQLRRPNQMWLAIELIGLLVIGLLLPPLSYFSAYFCLLHTPKHWLSMRAIGLYQRISQGVLYALWPTLLCLGVGLLVGINTTAWQPTEIVMRTVFIGLAVLTVPHWLLLQIYSARVHERQPGELNHDVTDG